MTETWKKIAIALWIIAGTIGAQVETPRLVVFISVDQLRGDFIEYFSPTLSQGGFKRLLGGGTVFADVEFDFPNLDCATATATLCTGANPVFHGIDACRTFDFDTEREYSILYDADYLGNYTDNHFSPKALISSTFGDELKIASKGRSKVFAIAPTPEAAILPAGHAGDAAFWIDEKNGKWATTTFYKDIPWYVDRYNNGPEALSARLTSMVWTPRLPLDDYRAFPYLLDELPFRHTFPPDRPESISHFKTSPFVNDEITRLSIQFLEYGALGKETVPDILSITYHAGLFLPQRSKEYTREVQDLYLRLDANLDTLLRVIDKKVGLARTLVVLTGTGYFDAEEDYPETILRHYGVFYPKRCLALLNMYLMATYGQERKWVIGYHNGQIFLDRKAIRDAGLNVSTVQKTAADFVREFTGVQEVVTADGICEDQGTHPSRRGDLILRLQPGRRLDFEQTSGWAVLPSPVIRRNEVDSPVIFFGNGISHERHSQSIKATQIAPTITHLLRVRPPNACSERGIQLR
ncbi:MAG: alkaline phosphatase family protein [Tannerellaceae bacterium]|jgi:hypothetical protein|nr:alkaline phosphatase family protein [Tannerellaceae bacterium]